MSATCISPFLDVSGAVFASTSELLVTFVIPPPTGKHSLANDEVRVTFGILLRAFVDRGSFRMKLCECPFLSLSSVILQPGESVYMHIFYGLFYSQTSQQGRCEAVYDLEGCASK